MADVKSFFLGADAHDYIVSHSLPVDEVQRDLIEETRTLGGVAGMQIAPEQGAFMTILTRLVGARRAVEVGTFTGYSSLCIARGLPDDRTADAARLGAPDVRGAAMITPAG